MSNKDQDASSEKTGQGNNKFKSSIGSDGKKEFGRSASSSERGSRDDSRGSYNRDNRSSGGDSRSTGGYNRDNRSEGGSGYNREQQDGASYNSDNRDTRKDDGGYSREFRSRSGGLRHVTAEERALGSENIRLNRFIAHAGICSRREADKLIEDGMVTVNGEVVTEMGHKVNPTDEVKYAGEKLKAEKPVYLLMNKPKGFITTVEDEKARKTVMDLIGDACKERIYPVGRLDRATTGTLLFTNDGDLAKKLMHPSNGAPKIYLATLDKPLSPADLEAIKEGVTLNDGLVPVDKIEMPNADNHTLVGIEIHLGRNRIVRRLFEHLGYEVTKLDRTSFAGLTKKQLNRGQFRFLSEKEVGFLKMI
ncbi:MAG: pseudouridine synthase [Flavobacteriales bacterium]